MLNSVPWTLSEELQIELTKITNLDPDWVIFVNDHCQYLQQRSQTLVITDEDREHFRYKLEFFLRERHVDRSLFWVVKLINQLNKYEDFTTLDQLMIPDNSDITSLWRQYQTSKIRKEVVL